jgi:hypothetical protein
MSKPSPSATSSTTNLIVSSLSLNPGLLSERLVTDPKVKKEHSMKNLYWQQFTHSFQKYTYCTICSALCGYLLFVPVPKRLRSYPAELELFVLTKSLSFPGPFVWFKWYPEATKRSPTNGDNSIHFVYIISVQVLMALSQQAKLQATNRRVAAEES